MEGKTESTVIPVITNEELEERSTRNEEDQQEDSADAECCDDDTVTVGTTSELNEPQSTSDEPRSEQLHVGDHVYKWCSFAGIPGMFQHHGIVLEINENDDLTIADFHNMIRHADDQPKVLLVRWPRGNLQVRGHQSPKDWKKVQYDASWLKRSLWRSGTCTAVKADPTGLVMARVQFLMDHTDKLPNYHFLKANCECLAVWCKTGAWATLQASSFLHVTAAGQAKSATTLALFASSQTVTVPSAGMWGWLGFTTKVSLLATQPWIVPALVSYGILTVGGPVWMLARAKSFWNTTTKRLNEEFWESAIDKPELFAERITEFSQIET